MPDQLGKMVIKIEVINSNLEGDRYELAVRCHDKYLVERISLHTGEIIDKVSADGEHL